ncbi:DUF4395 domain-containing protein [Paenalkalicoccus suaedae]|uniref:DUF4395 domain-containing protein n=1 Tax=Paenalkalicoccus suaedae TaxID=2592382 RepID=A0A859FFB3_9BACI|nr:DUF4395 domain-containing protein [Paenalkalicoccus suaedae]QKS71284.1 DUF4395 domain-containing protein [Paenalkalicoccus suaedae]
MIPKHLVSFNQVLLISTIGLGLLIHPVLLVIPFLVCLFSVIFGFNLFIRIGSFMLRSKTSEQMEDKDQLRFNQSIATICLGLSLLFFSTGLPSLGVIFASMVILASSLALAGFCVGCVIRYRYMMWKYKRTAN